MLRQLIFRMLPIAFFATEKSQQIPTHLPVSWLPRRSPNRRNCRVAQGNAGRCDGRRRGLVRVLESQLDPRFFHREDGRSARPRIFGVRATRRQTKTAQFPRDELRLEQQETSRISRPPCESRRSSRRADRATVTRGVPLAGVAGSCAFLDGFAGGEDLLGVGAQASVAVLVFLLATAAARIELG